MVVSVAKILVMSLFSFLWWLLVQRKVVQEVLLVVLKMVTWPSLFHSLFAIAWQIGSFLVKVKKMNDSSLIINCYHSSINNYSTVQ